MLECERDGRKNYNSERERGNKVGNFKECVWLVDSS